MKKLFTLIALVLCVTSVSAQEWTSLFNGKNLKGWTQLNGTAKYKVVDKAIVGVSTAGSPNSFLCTNQNYGDFILEFEVKIDEGLNSGVQFRSLSLKDYNNGRVHGYQFELDPSARAWTGGIYDEARRGWLYPLTDNQPAQKAYRHNEWNKARVECIGTSIRTFVNGVPCADVIDDMTLSGFIALQVHSIGKNTELEGKTISWRNIRILTKDVEKYATPDNPAVPQVNAIANSISPREAADGWKLLWDGKTTNGWRGAKLDHFPEKGWTIEDGILKVHSSKVADTGNGGDIVTVRRYKDFILKVDFQITKGANSGIKYFVDPESAKGDLSSIGCEYQVLDDNNHPDAKLGVKGNRKLGSLYDLIPAPEVKPYYGNGFSTAMIVVKGNHVEHWLNGVKLLEYERNNQMWDALVAYSKFRNYTGFGNAAEGHLLLQDHGDEVWYKNIKIKEL